VKYRIPPALRSQVRGKRVAIVNDVINAGSAVRGTFLDLRNAVRSLWWLPLCSFWAIPPNLRYGKQPDVGASRLFPVLSGLQPNARIVLLVSRLIILLADAHMIHYSVISIHDSPRRYGCLLRLRRGA
jgi:hypothetical protein